MTGDHFVWLGNQLTEARALLRTALAESTGNTQDPAVQAAIGWLRQLGPQLKQYFPRTDIEQIIIKETTA